MLVEFKIEERDPLYTFLKGKGKLIIDLKELESFGSLEEFEDREVNFDQLLTCIIIHFWLEIYVNI